MKNIVVIYHNDLDGFGSAWSAWKKFGNKADYFAVDYGNSELLGLKNKEIYMLDFGYKESALRELLKTNKKVVMIDHHISRGDIVKILKDYVWDTNRAACILSWKYFQPNKKIPKLLEYVEDTDLWKFRLKNMPKISAFLEGEERNFKLWDKIAAGMENKKIFSGYLSKGELILNFTSKIIKYVASNAKEAVFEGKRAIIVNSPIFNSELGQYLIRKTKAPIIIIWSLKNGEIRVSMRSIKKVDVSKIAQKYGGGGHKQAAGFSLDIDAKFPWKIKK